MSEPWEADYRDFLREYRNERRREERRFRRDGDAWEAKASAFVCLIEALEEMRPYARTEMEPMSSLESVMVIR